MHPQVQFSTNKNLCVYSLGNRAGTCYLWNEVDGGRGSNEIGTCMNTYINCLPPTTKHVILYSDACGGQNRNRFFATAMIYALQCNPPIEKIDHKFMESGHSEMEVDFMHAAIETAKKNVSVYVPSDWKMLCHLARKQKPYTVVSLSNEQIISFREMQAKVQVNLNQVKWPTVKWLRFERAANDASVIAVMQKSSFDDEFSILNDKKTRRKGPRNICLEPVPAYNGKLLISKAKKNDMLALCRDGTIPREHQEFYMSLPSQESDDRLPEPNVDEESDEDS